MPVIESPSGSDPTDESGSSAPRRRRPHGRPRSRESHLAIRRATIDLLEESGLMALTVEAVAARSGTSKATIYRWWPSKASLAMEAFVAEMIPELPFVSTGDIRHDFRLHLRKMVDVLNTTLGRTLAEIIAEMQHDDDLAATFREQYIDPQRRAPRVALQAAVAAGQVAGDANPDVIMDSLYGAMYFALLVRNHEIDTAFVDRLVEQVLGPSDHEPGHADPA
ncbi:TetR/AcrR family transcriptional regulator [Pseudonocardia ailaonensis]|uniref:TetR/AcrR family transcriptional regulator n=1 Tax=Pseudonocardia ailaonensis TaxID=367279 RepID=A0ABN2NAD0_9PSEU